MACLRMTLGQPPVDILSGALGKYRQQQVTAKWVLARVISKDFNICQLSFASKSLFINTRHASHLLSKNLFRKEHIDKLRRNLTG